MTAGNTACLLNILHQESQFLFRLQSTSLRPGLALSSQHRGRPMSQVVCDFGVREPRSFTNTDSSRYQSTDLDIDATVHCTRMQGEASEVLRLVRGRDVVAGDLSPPCANACDLLNGNSESMSLPSDATDGLLETLTLRGVTHGCAFRGGHGQVGWKNWSHCGIAGS